MIDLFDAAWEAHTFLTTHQVLYVFIGGLAVQYWGEPPHSKRTQMVNG